MSEGWLLYPTRAVTLDAAHSVARLNAQLADGLHDSPYPVQVLQEHTVPADARGRFATQRLRNTPAARLGGRALKAAGRTAQGGHLRRSGWYEAAARHIGTDPRFVITSQASSVSGLRRHWPTTPIFLWLHDLPAGDGREAAIAGARDATVVVTASTYVRDRLWQLTADRAAPASMWVVPYAIDDQTFRPGDENARERWRAALGIERSQRVLGFASNILPHKGLQTVLAALHGLRRAGDPSSRDSRLLIAGDEAQDHGGRFRAMATDFGVPLSFTGRLPPARLRQYYCSLDALLVPSAWAEPFGLVALEALVCGTPVLASRAGGLAAVCADQPGAVLVDPPTSPEAWAAALRTFFTTPGGGDPSPSSVRYSTLAAFLERWHKVLDHHVPANENISP